MLDPKYLALFHEAMLAVTGLEAAINRTPTAEQLIQKEGNPLAHLTDAIYAARETYNLLDNLRKAVNRVNKKLQQTACVLYLESSPAQQAEFSDTGSVIGEYATGKPKTNTSVESLKRVKSPELYDRFCREVLGVTNESLIQSGAVEVQYKYFGEWITQQLADGYVKPDVMDQVKTYNEYEFSVTKKRPLLS